MAEPNRCSIVYPTAAHEGELARERRGFVFERGCVVRRCVAPSSVGCAVHRWSGRFAPNAPLFRPGTAKNAAITPPLCRRQHIHANRGRQCGADGLDSFMRLNMRDDAIGRDGLNTICGWPCRFKRRGARSAMSYAAKKVRSFFWRWRFMTRRSSSWRLGGVQEMAFAPASIVARMVSSFGPPLAMIGRFG